MDSMSSSSEEEEEEEEEEEGNDVEVDTLAISPPPPRTPSLGDRLPPPTRETVARYPGTLQGGGRVGPKVGGGWGEGRSLLQQGLMQGSNVACSEASGVQDDMDMDHGATPSMASRQGT